MVIIVCLFFHFSSLLLVNDAMKFAEASERGNLVPLYRCIFSDHLTPVLAYRCLVQEDDREAPSFLFESVEPGSRVSNVVRPIVFGILYLVHFEYMCSSNYGLCI